MAEPASELSRADMPFPVVGIGASAGGLEAIGDLLAALPAATGMAFLIVQHLDPERASLLTEILGKKTAMSVTEVRDGMAIAPDHVYVIPPNTLLSLAGDMLRLEARAEGRQPSMPVDILFNSLAEERGHNAIGIVLSGTGSDGARGVQAIKEGGGITLAQEETSASFSGMPNSAIGTGCVDFIQAPREMGATLLRIGRHPYLHNGATPQADSESSGTPAPNASANETAFKHAFRMLRASSGVDFTHYKRSTIERRIGRRLAVHHLDHLPAYVDFLQDNPSELPALAHDLLIGVTSFFRDPDGIEGLTQTVFPALMEGRSSKEALRIWVPGCASGEEVYSIAISLVEFMGPRAVATPIQIFGTDVSETAIERARVGIYLASIAAEVSPERLARFFVKLDDHYQIAKSIRDLCVFARHDVTHDPPFSRLDLVSCCNLLIYLDQALQRQMLSLFHYALKPRGFLMLGPSESVGPNAGLFELIDKRRRIYVRKSVPGRPVFEADRGAAPPHHDAARMTAAPAMLETERMQREADRVLLARYAPACVVIDEDLNVLQFRGQTAPFLEHAPGPASLNLRKLAPPGVLIALESALLEARGTHAPVRTATVRLETRDGAREIRMQVSPFRVADAELHGYLIAFEDALPMGGDKSRHSFWGAWFERAWRTRAGASNLAGEERARVEQELAATREYLQAAIEEHEAAKEELRSAHEEVLSSNEELQSTNEELETAKEELQSANEELITTNDELRNRNRELSELNEALRDARDYAEAIIETTPAPLIVLDHSLRVMRANHSFYQLFKTRPEDTEPQMLYDLGNRQWDIPQLRTLLETILPRNSQFMGYEVRHTFPEIGAKIMRLNARRLAGGNHRPGMILLGIEDCTEAEHAREASAAADRSKDEFLAMLAHELRNPLAPMSLAVGAMRAVDSENATISSGVTVIERQVAHLARLVDDLLDVSRMSSGKIVIQKKRIALDYVIDMAVELARPLIDERKHRLSVESAPQPIYLEGDSDRLVQVVANLLNNAAKFTVTGGELTLSTHAEDHEAVIKVRDSGSGIPARLLPHVFDLFFQAEPSYARARGGIGVGLALARQLIELHGGTIEAQSEGDGKGAEFTVRLPRHDEAPAAPAVPASAQGERPARPGHRILVVDDNADVVRMAQILLEAYGHEVRCASDGLSAVDLAQQFEPRLILLDIGMPGTDGYEVVSRLRETPAGAAAVITAVTGYSPDNSGRRLKQLGFDHYLVKPVAAEAMLALIASLDR